MEAHFSRGAIRKVAGGQTLWSEGEECRYVYLVRSGCVRLSQMLPDGRRAVHHFAAPGDVMGVGSIIHGRDAEAVEPTSLYALSLPRLRRAMQDDPAFLNAINAMVRRSLRAAQEHVTVLSRLAAGERIAHFLIELQERNLRGDGDPLRIRIPMRRLDVADYLGLTVETVCRTLTSFRNAGLIAMDHADDVRATDIRRLKALATGESDPGDPMRRAS
jgi:CRP-like cAMP-binding protein